MSNTYTLHKKGSRDANEPSILRVAECLGYLDFDRICKEEISIDSVRGFFLTQHPGNGHDVTFYDQYGSFVIEIKNLSGHDAKGTLRPREEVLRDLCAAMGQPWHVVTNEQEIADVLAGRLEWRP